ncbi:endonuclease/exonuclease/phosphatase family protein [Jatrophihabitans sp.]|uniref:endonuclease/exonuclease/phosphatase family protein n=1 Tax=Jatrophihabitans sp. TaxID=1932789 RepID=UPI0030C72D8E|nr:hypothetical protein [Jatrophihabitans sp.]
MTLSPAFNAATYNIGDGPDDAKVKHLEHLTDHYGVSIVGMQECSDRRKTLARFRKRNPSWKVYQSRLPGGAADPIIWDGDEWEVLTKRSVLAVRRRRVGPRGAGPSVIKTKRVTVVVLRHRHTGEVVTVINLHPLPSASRHDLPAEEKAAREKHFREHIACVVAILAATDGAVVLTGDLNAADDFQPMRPLHIAGLVGWTQSPTHGRETFDYVLSRLLELVREKVVAGGSDHCTVIHMFRFLPKEHR